jgi:hypothetical protein
MKVSTVFFSPMKKQTIKQITVHIAVRRRRRRQHTYTEKVPV